MIDISKLQDLTQDAIRRGEIAAIELKAKKEKAEKDRVKSCEHFVERVLDELPGHLEQTAAKGEDTHTVCTLSSHECLHDSNNRTANPRFNLSGNGLRYHLLVEALKKAGLNPVVEFRHDCAGIQSWHAIVVSWKKNS